MKRFKVYFNPNFAAITAVSRLQKILGKKFEQTSAEECEWNLGRQDIGRKKVLVQETLVGETSVDENIGWKNIGGQNISGWVIGGQEHG